MYLQFSAKLLNFDMPENLYSLQKSRLKISRSGVSDINIPEVGVSNTKVSGSGRVTNTYSGYRARRPGGTTP